MGKSLFNKNIETINYVSADKQAVLSFGSSSSTDVRMLMDSATLAYQRPSVVKRFFNDSPALLIGQGSGTVEIRGLFGTAEQLKELCGDPDDPCKIPKTLTFRAGILQACGNINVDSVGKTDLILHDCVVQSFNIQMSLQENGMTFQQATVQLTVTDVSIA